MHFPTLLLNFLPYSALKVRLAGTDLPGVGGGGEGLGQAEVKGASGAGGVQAAALVCISWGLLVDF